MAIQKTNVIRRLDQAKVQYEAETYETSDGKIDGVSVAEKIGKNADTVFKTLLVQGKSKACYVCVIPVHYELDLKKVSQLTGEKKVDMLPVSELLKATGYIRGGCSPIGMKKLYPTYIHESAAQLEEMTVSGGKIGLQITLRPEDLRALIQGCYAVLV